MSADEQADFRYDAVPHIQAALISSGIESNASAAHRRAKDIFDGKDSVLRLDDQGHAVCGYATNFTELFPIRDINSGFVVGSVRLHSYDGKPRP
jgi:hypothetical protein